MTQPTQTLSVFSQRKSHNMMKFKKSQNWMDSQTHMHNGKQVLIVQQTLSVKGDS